MPGLSSYNINTERKSLNDTNEVKCFDIQLCSEAYIHSSQA